MPAMPIVAVLSPYLLAGPGGKAGKGARAGWAQLARPPDLYNQLLLFTDSSPWGQAWPQTGLQRSPPTPPLNLWPR